MAILGFKHPPYDFLSNMHPCHVPMFGYDFRSLESAYQAAKCRQLPDRARFAPLDGYAAKRLGRAIDCLADWDSIKVSVMHQLICLKFASGSALAGQLLETHPHKLVEVNTWKDTFWGVCDGVGENRLGELLMLRRDYLHSQAKD